MSIVKIVSYVSLHKLTRFIRQRVASYSSDICMLPVVSLVTYTCKARVLSDFFCNKDIVAASPKRILLYILMHILMAKMAVLKHGIPNEETESRNGVRNQISMTEKYYMKIP